VGRRRRWLLALGAGLFALYVGAYYHLSRRGYEFESMSDRFYYFPPKDTAAWRAKHTGCVYLFAPANAVDQWLFAGRPPGAVPPSPF
jgi:hypothetical protein